jgi:hypothetical protein
MLWKLAVIRADTFQMVLLTRDMITDNHRHWRLETVKNYNCDQALIMELCT